jgi:hypothetical protein
MLNTLENLIKLARERKEKIQRQGSSTVNNLKE